MATAEILENDKPDQWYFTPQRQEAINVLLSGFIFGIVVALMSYILDTYVIQKLFCSASSASLCSDTATLAFNISLGLGVCGVVAWLTMQRIFRPALIGLPLGVVFWSLPSVNLFGHLYGHTFELALFLSFVGAAIALSFYWLARLKSFFAIAAVWLVLVFALRWFIA